MMREFEIWYTIHTRYTLDTRCYELYFIALAECVLCVLRNYINNYIGVYNRSTYVYSKKRRHIHAYARVR